MGALEKGGVMLVRFLFLDLDAAGYTAATPVESDSAVPS